MATFKRSFVLTSITLVAVATGIAISALVVDIHRDRHSQVRVTGQVKVYDRESPAGYTRGDDGVIEILRPADQVGVMRIIFHENEGFESIRVRLRDGREGYIFCCDNFELSR
jgi:hypothetical protein